MNCPICCRVGRPWGVKDGYGLERCVQCEHLYATRRPDPQELSRLYNRYCYDQRSLAAVPPFVLARLRELMQPLLRPGCRNRLLDVGFGAGALLRAATDLGFDAQGLETSGLAVELARRHGFKVEEGDFVEVPWESGSFDVVCMIELLEHVRDPVSFLRKAQQLLVRGGALFLTTPNGMGLSAWLLREHWSVVAPPEHIQLFSPRSIRQALAVAQFEDVDIRCEGVNPSELIARLPWRRAPPAAAGGRVAAAQALNERLARHAFGRIAKAVANTALSVTRLGDSLKVRATA